MRNVVEQNSYHHKGFSLFLYSIKETKTIFILYVRKFDLIKSLEVGSIKQNEGSFCISIRSLSLLNRCWLDGVTLKDSKFQLSQKYLLIISTLMKRKQKLELHLFLYFQCSFENE